MLKYILSEKDEWFLDEENKDPYTSSIFKIGDAVIICSKCGTAHRTDTWEFYGKCGQCGCNKYNSFINSNSGRDREMYPRITSIPRDAIGETRRGLKPMHILIAICIFVGIILGIIGTSVVNNYNQNDDIVSKNSVDQIVTTYNSTEEDTVTTKKESVEEYTLEQPYLMNYFYYIKSGPESLCTVSFEMYPISDADDYMIEYLDYNDNWSVYTGAFWYEENGKIIVQFDNVEDNNDLTVRIMATNNTREKSRWSEPLTFLYPDLNAAQPKNLVTTLINESSIEIAWDRQEYSSNYEVAVVVNDKWYIIDQSTDSYILDDLESDTLYDIYVVVSEKTDNGNLELYSNLLNIKTDSTTTSIQAKMQDVYIYLNHDNTYISNISGWVNTNVSTAQIQYRLSDGEWLNGSIGTSESGNMSFSVDYVGDSFCDIRIVENNIPISEILHIPASADFFKITPEIPFIVLDSVTDKSISISFSDMENDDAVIPFIAVGNYGCGTHYVNITSHRFVGKQCDNVTVQSGEVYEVHVSYYFYLDKSKEIKYIVETEMLEVETD